MAAASSTAGVPTGKTSDVTTRWPRVSRPALLRAQGLSDPPARPRRDGRRRRPWQREPQVAENICSEASRRPCPRAGCRDVLSAHAKPASTCAGNLEERVHNVNTEIPFMKHVMCEPRNVFISICSRLSFEFRRCPSAPMRLSLPNRMSLGCLIDRVVGAGFKSTKLPKGQFWKDLEYHVPQLPTSISRAGFGFASASYVRVYMPAHAFALSEAIRQ